jgi:hypothetical protein
MVKKFILNPEASKLLSKIASELELSEDQVLIKGLLLMKLCAKFKTSGEGTLLLQDSSGIRELIVSAFIPRG